MMPLASLGEGDLLPARASEQGNVIGLVSVCIYIYINTMAECRSGRKCIAVK